MKTKRTRAPVERADAPLRWLRANGHNLAALTGQDTRALLAIAACWNLWGYGNQAAALAAVRALLPAMQPSTRWMAREVIPWALDWSHRDQLWPQVSPWADEPDPEVLSDVLEPGEINDGR